MLAIVNRAMVVEKGWIIYRRISRFTDFSKFSFSKLRYKCKERANLFCVERIAAETTSFNLIDSQHRSQRDRKLKADNTPGPSPLR